MSKITNWKELIADKLDGDVLIACTLSEEELIKEFDSGYGGAEGKDFTAWSEKYVYFPVCYDGAEWVERAPRNPCDEACGHAGGW